MANLPSRLARLLVALGLWLARLGGWIPPLVSAVTAPLDHAELAAVKRELSYVKGTLLHDALDHVVVLERHFAKDWTKGIDTTLLARTRELVTKHDEFDHSGEAKRHAVYAQLLKEFPTARKRDVALAIEIVLLQAPKEG